MAINIEVTADTSQVVGKVADMAEEYDRVSDTLKDLAKAGDSAGNDLMRSLEDAADPAKDIERGAKKAGDALDDLGKDGKDAGKDLEKGLREGETAAQRLDREVDQAFDSISSNARKGSKGVGDGARDGFREAGHASEEFKDEAKSNISETVSSFRGDMEDIPQIAQDILGGVSGSFGAAGLAITAGFAAAIGIAVGKLQSMAEENTAAAEAAAQLGNEFYTVGGKLDSAAIAEKVQDIAFSLAEEDSWWKWGDQAKTYLDVVKDALGDTDDALAKLSFEGLAGDTDSAAQALAQLERKLQDGKDALEEHVVTMRNGVPVYDEGGRAIQDQAGKLEELKDKLIEESGISGDAAEQAEYLAQIMGDSADATQAAADAVRDHADALNEAAGNAMGVVEAENDYLSTLGEVSESVAENGQTLDANTEAGRANRESLIQIAEAANGYRDAAIAAGEGTDSVTGKVQASRDAFIAAAEAAGLDRAAAEELATSYGLVPGNVETQVAAYGTDEAKAAVQGVGEPVEAPVNVTTNGTEAAAQGAVQSVQGTEAPVDVTTEGTDKSTQGSINAIKGKDVKIDVDDEYTVRAVQDRINGIRGKDVFVNVRIANEAQFRGALNALTAPRSTSVTVNERKGTSVI